MAGALGVRLMGQRSYDGELAADAYRKYHPRNAAAVGPVTLDSQESLVFLKFNMLLTARTRAHRFERALQMESRAWQSQKLIARPVQGSRQEAFLARPLDDRR